MTKKEIDLATTYDDVVFETHICLRLPTIVDLDGRSSVSSRDNLKRPVSSSENKIEVHKKMNLPVTHIILNFLVLELPTDQAFEGKHGVMGVDNSLTLGRQANKTLAVFGESHHRGRCPCTLCVLNDAGSLTLHHRNARVCCSQVNTNHRAYG